MMVLLLRRRINGETTRKCKKRMCVQTIFKERKQKDEFHLLVHDMRLFDGEFFFKYFRMCVTQ